MEVKRKNLRAKVQNRIAPATVEKVSELCSQLAEHRAGQDSDQWGFKCFAIVLWRGNEEMMVTTSGFLLCPSL